MGEDVLAALCTGSRAAPVAGAVPSGLQATDRGASASPSEAVTERALLDVWGFDREENLAAGTVVAIDRLSPPDFRVSLLRSYGDAIVVELLEGVPSGDPDAVFYLERLGLYELARREDWPPALGEDRPRTLLTLAAFPRR